MKTLPSFASLLPVFAIAGLTLLSAVGARAQPFGILMFTNLSARITNGLTMQVAVRDDPPLLAVIYVAADGVTNESQFTAMGDGVLVGAVGAGGYGGGPRSILPYAPSTPVMIQLRVFELSYGATYEAAYAALPVNGRRALVGRSRIARVILGATSPPPVAPLVGPAVGSFTVLPVEGYPDLTASDFAASEGSNGVATALFTLRLLSAPTNEVTVDFATQDGTALAGQDYVATNGTVTFLPGELVKAVPVTLLADVPPEPLETFDMVLSNPVNTTLLRTVVTCTIVEVQITGLRFDTAVSFNTLAGKRYTLEKSTNALDWVTVPGATNLLGTGSIMTVTDPGTSCMGMGIYRASISF